MMTDMINFCGYVAYYALGKSILHTVYTMLFVKGKGLRYAGRRLRNIALTAGALWLGWRIGLATEYAVWMIVIASILCARIVWREFKTLFGILDDDWSLDIGCFKVIDWEDWGIGFVDVLEGNWSLFDIFKRDSRYEEDRRMGEFYHDARWYYDYGDGRNG